MPHASVGASAGGHGSFADGADFYDGEVRENADSDICSHDGDLWGRMVLHRGRTEVHDGLHQRQRVCPHGRRDPEIFPSDCGENFQNSEAEMSPN